MNRRNFLKRGSLMLSSGALAGISGVFPPVSAFAAASSEFSIDVVTGDAVRAIQRFEPFLRQMAPAGRPVKFSEYRLPGSHLGDIAFVRDRRLIDYHQDAGEVSRQLRRAAADLGLPRRIEDPALLRFYTEDEGEPETVQVFRGTSLLARLPLKTAGVHRFDGVRGPLELAIENRAAAIASVACRHKTCMEMGAISRAGQHLVCIPNRITIAIAGGSGLGVDGISR